MKIIFLDIDGVLNHENWYHWRMYCYHHNMHDKIYTSNDAIIRQNEIEIDERSVAYLNTIIEKTGAKIVLSSSWRSSLKEENELTNLVLKRKGLICDIFDVTGRDVKESKRGNEIEEWLSTHCQEFEIESYCIIDDNIFDMLEYQIENCVCVDPQVGIVWQNVELAIDILNNTYDRGY